MRVKAYKTVQNCYILLYITTVSTFINYLLIFMIFTAYASTKFARSDEVVRVEYLLMFETYSKGVTNLVPSVNPNENTSV